MKELIDQLKKEINKVKNAPREKQLLLIQLEELADTTQDEALNTFLQSIIISCSPIKAD